MAEKMRDDERYAADIVIRKLQNRPTGDPRPTTEFNVSR